MPLAVRSSSLLEDSRHQPFTGVYETLVIANDRGTPAERMVRLSAAIRRVYSSVFTRAAKAYLTNTLRHSYAFHHPPQEAVHSLNQGTRGW